MFGFGAYRPKYNGAEVRETEVRDLACGQAIWLEDDSGNDVRRVVASITYNPKRQLVKLWYEGYLGDDLWGATATVQREVKK